MGGVEPADRIAKARGVRSPAEAIEVYRSWAEDYDADVFGTLGFTGTDRIADLLAAHVADRKAPVIDLGCGTGAAGVRLRDHGFGVIDGLDISPEMLAVAERKGAYRRLIVADLHEPVPLADSSYAATVSAGTFTTGHVGVDALAEILRVLRPGATIAWVIGDLLWDDFRPALEHAGVSTLYDGREPTRRGGPPEATMFVGRSSPPWSADLRDVAQIR